MAWMRIVEVAVHGLGIQSLVHQRICDQRGDGFVDPWGDLKGMREVRIGRTAKRDPNIGECRRQPALVGGARENVIQVFVGEVVTPLLATWEGRRACISIVKDRHAGYEVICICLNEGWAKTG